MIHAFVGSTFLCANQGHGFQHIAHLMKERQEGVDAFSMHLKIEDWRKSLTHQALGANNTKLRSEQIVTV